MTERLGRTRAMLIKALSLKGCHEVMIVCHKADMCKYAMNMLATLSPIVPKRIDYLTCEIASTRFVFLSALVSVHYFEGSDGPILVDHAVWEDSNCPPKRQSELRELLERYIAVHGTESEGK